MGMTRRTLLALGTASALIGATGCQPASPSSTPSPVPSDSPTTGRVDPEFFLKPGSLDQAMTVLEPRLGDREVYALGLTAGWVTIETRTRKYTWAGPDGEFRDEPWTPPRDALPVDLDALPLVDLSTILRRAEKAVTNPGPPNPRPFFYLQNRASLGLPTASIEPGIKGEKVSFDESIVPRRRLDLLTREGVSAAYAELLFKTGLIRATQVVLEPRNQVSVFAPNDPRVTGVKKAKSMTVHRGLADVHSAATGEGEEPSTDPSFDARTLKPELVFEALRVLQSEGTVEDWWGQVTPDEQGQAVYAVTTRGVGGTQRSIYLDAAGQRRR
ncbi:hypothetical protein GCM10027418_17300 [Mariniluteicoccus endophyticus]